MILRESLMLSGLGGLVGIAIGVGLTLLLAQIPAVGSFFAATFSLQLFAQALIIALILGALGGLYPAWRATKLRPIEALRYE
jgi:putative ABC transport system permease protein